MKFSANWIQELVPSLPLDPREAGRMITLKTAECEGVEPYGAHLDAVCTAKVLSVEEIAGSSNRKAVVDTGRYGIRTVVCGAPNCRAGLVTAYVPPGTLGIRKSVIAGIESDGMLAAGVELGINRDGEGILELSGEPGAPVPGCRPDHVIEIDNKSLNHRPDLWGHLGIAREVAATHGAVLRDPVDLGRLPAPGGPLRVEIEDHSLCPRYSALVFENVTIGPSPLWLQYRLETVGLNPINNIVDVTNYVMAELAQPTHAFDADLLHGDTIFVRRARAGERVLALNDETYELDPQTLVIADANGAEAIAGVIGGRPTGIHAGTRRVVLESASFHASSIRKTSSRLKVRTDASMRFEKAQDPHNTVRALARCMELFEQVSPGIRLAGGLMDNCAPLPAPPAIRLSLDYADRKIGRAVEPAEARRILEALCFGVREESPRVFLVSVPTWRATKDISLPIDLVEEIGRMIGYDSIPPHPPLVQVTAPAPAPQRGSYPVLRAMIAARGFTEVYNYSFLSDGRAVELGLDPAAHLRVLNPIASDQSLMRISLLPGILKNLADNSRHMDRFRLFEIGHEIHKQPEGLPAEIPHLVAAVYARSGDGHDGLFELKGLAESLLAGIALSSTGARRFEHPARVWTASFAGQTVGRLCEVHPDYCEGRGAVLDLDLDAMTRVHPVMKRYQPLRRFPVSAFDLSIVAGMRVAVGDLESRVASLAGELLVAVEFVRQYAGPPLPEGTKSVSFRVTVGAAAHTLSAEEISEIRARVITGLQSEGYELRL